MSGKERHRREGIIVNRAGIILKPSVNRFSVGIKNKDKTN